MFVGVGVHDESETRRRVVMVFVGVGVREERQWRRGLW